MSSIRTIKNSVYADAHILLYWMIKILFKIHNAILLGIKQLNCISAFFTKPHYLFFVQNVNVAPTLICNPKKVLKWVINWNNWSNSCKKNLEEAWYLLFAGVFWIVFFLCWSSLGGHLFGTPSCVLYFSQLYTLQLQVYALVWIL